MPLSPRPPKSPGRARAFRRRGTGRTYRRQSSRGGGVPSPRSRAPPVKQGYLYVRNVGTATFNRRLFVLRRDGVLLTASAPTSASDLSAGESSASQIDVTDPAVQKSLTPVGQLLDVRVTSVLRFELTFVTELAGHIPVRVQRSADADGWLRACYDCRSRAEEERVMRLKRRVLTASVETACAATEPQQPPPSEHRRAVIADGDELARSQANATRALLAEELRALDADSRERREAAQASALAEAEAEAEAAAARQRAAECAARELAQSQANAARQFLSEELRVLYADGAERQAEAEASAAASAARVRAEAEASARIRRDAEAMRAEAEAEAARIRAAAASLLETERAKKEEEARRLSTHKRELRNTGSPKAMHDELRALKARRSEADPSSCSSSERSSSSSHRARAYRRGVEAELALSQANATRQFLSAELRALDAESADERRDAADADAAAAEAEAAAAAARQRAAEDASRARSAEAEVHAELARSQANATRQFLSAELRWLDDDARGRRDEMLEEAEAAAAAAREDARRAAEESARMRRDAEAEAARLAEETEAIRRDAVARAEAEAARVREAAAAEAASMLLRSVEDPRQAPPPREAATPERTRWRVRGAASGSGSPADGSPASSAYRSATSACASSPERSIGAAGDAAARDGDPAESPQAHAARQQLRAELKIMEEEIGRAVAEEQLARSHANATRRLLTEELRALGDGGARPSSPAADAADEPTKGPSAPTLARRAASFATARARGNGAPRRDAKLDRRAMSFARPAARPGRPIPPPIPSISEEISEGKAAVEATTQPRPGKENGWRMRPATLALAAGRKARRLVVRQPLFVSPQR